MPGRLMGSPRCVDTSARAGQGSPEAPQVRWERRAGSASRDGRRSRAVTVFGSRQSVRRACRGDTATLRRRRRTGPAPRARRDGPEGFSDGPVRGILTAGPTRVARDEVSTGRVVATVGRSGVGSSLRLAGDASARRERRDRSPARGATRERPARRRRSSPGPRHRGPSRTRRGLLPADPSVFDSLASCRPAGRGSRAWRLSQEPRSALREGHLGARGVRFAIRSFARREWRGSREAGFRRRYSRGACGGGRLTVGMARRLEIELTSARHDGTWTWRAAGARRTARCDRGQAARGRGEGGQRPAR